MSKGPLTRVEKHFIKTSGLELDALCKELQRPKKTVKKVLDEHNISVRETQQKDSVVEAKKEETPFEKTLGKGTAGGRDGVVIMTEAGSQFSDDAKKKIKTTKKTKNPDYVKKVR